MKGPWAFLRESRAVLLFAWVSLVTCGIFLSPNGARGQGTSTASVTGTVLDSTGAVIPGAQIVTVDAKIC
jgi:hypothetical protein